MPRPRDIASSISDRMSVRPRSTAISNGETEPSFGMVRSAPSLAINLTTSIWLAATAIQVGVRPLSSCRLMPASSITDCLE